MGHSWKVLQANFSKYYDIFYNYMVKFIYYGSVPLIVAYGKHRLELNPSRTIFKAIQPPDPSFLGMDHRTRAASARYVRTPRWNARILLIWSNAGISLLRIVSLNLT